MHIKRICHINITQFCYSNSHLICQERSDMSREEQICTICGKQGVYARGLCRTCYERVRKNGGVKTEPYLTAARKRWIGQTANGWEVIEHLPKDKVLCKCQYCGRTKIISKDGIRNSTARPCVCHIERLKPKTEAQARIYSAVMRNKGNGFKAAKELGMTRQAVYSVLETMRKNK